MKDKSSMDFLKESMAQYRKDKKLDFDSALINLNKSLFRIQGDSKTRRYSK